MSRLSLGSCIPFAVVDAAENSGESLRVGAALNGVLASIQKPSGKASMTWSDEDYSYMEVQIPEGTHLDLDLNIHDSTVLIRMIRQEPS